MNLTLRSKLILFTSVLVSVIMIVLTISFTVRQMHLRRQTMVSQIQHIAENIASMQLLNRQEWSVYQNYISQLMSVNEEIVYIAIFDERHLLRAHTLNSEWLELEDAVRSRKIQADLVLRLDHGEIAEESRDDFQTEHVDIKDGDLVLGSVHVGFSLININRELGEKIALNLLFGAFFVIVFSTLAAWISHRISRPIEQLNEAMLAVRNGDFNQRVISSSRDEIGTLTRSFNAMANGLRERRIIDDLGNELSASIQLEQLALLVRERLREAIGAKDARLYIQDSDHSGYYIETTVTEKETDAFPPIKTDQTVYEYLISNNAGFMILDSPPHVLSALQHSGKRVNGLVIPLRAQNNLIGMLFFELPAGKDQFSENEQLFAHTLSNQAVLAIENAMLYKQMREKERLQRELEIARDVQVKLLPGAMPELPGYEIDAVCLPAFEVGGDYFDFFHLDDQRLGLVIADVSGKGTSASFYMAEIKGMMTQLCHQHQQPHELMIQLNRHLYQSLESHIYITMVYGILDTTNHKLSISRAGHSPVLHGGNNGRIYSVTPPGIGLGLDDGSRFPELIETMELDLPENEFVFLYTDGVTEAMDSSQCEYGESRLEQLLVSCRDQSAVTIKQRLMADIESFTGKATQNDDLTFIVLKRLGMAGSATKTAARS